MKAKRNQSSGASLARWTKSNQVSSNQEENYRSNVPIYATLIGAFVTTLNLIFAPLILRFLDNKDISKGGLYYSILVMISTIHLPLVLAFTIKYNKKNNIVAPIVPGTLQFHEDKEECHEEKSESQNGSIVPEVHQFQDDNKKGLDENCESQNIPIAPGEYQFHEDYEESLKREHQ